MRKVNCETCGAAYEVDPRRVPANGMKMRCPACGASVHVAPEAAKPEAKLSLSDLDLDLPAPKPRPPALAGAAVAALPPIKAPAKPAPKLPDLELSDLPAVKPRAPGRAAVPSLSSAAGDDLTDLPAPKAPSKVGFQAAPLAQPKPSAPKPSLPAPTIDPLASFARPADKKTTPAKLRPVELPNESIGSIDLLSDLDIDIDLPAPKNKPNLGFEPAAPKTKPDARPALQPQSFDELTPHGLELDSPLDRQAPAMPKKSFAKPAANVAASPRAAATEPSPPPSMRSDGGGMMPKDSLAIDPQPFFASAPPLGMFGKLDDVHGEIKPMTAPTPSIDVIDLPAPNDLPAVKRPHPKATALGLGLGARTMPKDSLDMPAEFGGRSASVSLNNLPQVLPATPPAPQNSQEAKPERASLPLPELSELDLPAPRDLPALKKRAPAATALGLGGAFGQSIKGSGGFEVQLLGSAGKGAGALAKPAPGAGGAAASAREPELSLDLPPMTGREGPRAEIDLGDFELALDNLESKGGGSFGALGGAQLDLPPRTPARRDAPSFGDLEPIALPNSHASNQNSSSALGAPMHTMELAPGDLTLAGPERGLSLSDTGDRQHFGDSAGRRGELGLELQGMGDLSSLPPSEARGSSGGNSFGELDLGLGRSPTAGLPLAVPARRPNEADAAKRGPKVEDAEFVDDGADEFEKKLHGKRSGGRKLPGWAVPLVLVALVGGTGTALGLFTEHGYFGVYLLEQLLPAAGNPARVREAIQQAERQAKSDTYVDVRRSLVTLSDARNEAGLNRGLLARSLLHEALYQLRFGEDAASAQRAAAILTRVLERGTSVPGLALARAAEAARTNDLATAKLLLADVPAGDPYRGLVAGEIALLEKQPDAAASAFVEAIKLGETARGQWGLARARIATNKLDEAEAAAKATLVASPRHPPAHTLVAERALSRGAIDVALEHAHAAAGYTAIEGTPAKPSRMERARAFALEGRIEELRDHPREAQTAYERALAADPRGVSELLGSGRMLMRLGRPQDALSRFDSALSAKASAIRGNDGTIPLLEAGSGAVQALLALQRAQEALPRSTALLAQFPGEADVKLWHGHVLEALERFDEAEASFHEAIDQAPKQFSGYVALSQLLFARGRPEEAARTLSIAAGQVKDSAEVRRMLGNSELARNHLPEAIQQFEAALRFDANDPGALYGLVVAQRKTGENDRASVTLERLAKADPTFPGLALERGQILENRGEYVAATAAYREALAQRPTDSELKLRLGAALVTAGQIDEAESVLNQVIKERPTSAEAEHYLGRILFARHETAQAAQRFERAVNFDNLKAEYHLYLAWALVEQGNYGGALESVQRAIQRDPNLGDARWILGRIQLRTGAVRDALANFQAALRLKPGRVEALANIGDAYDELRESSQAIKSYQEAVKRVPDNAEWWYRLGQLELDKGRREEARAALGEAVLRADKLRERPSWLAEAHRAYGDVLREAHRNAEAAEHYRLFLELAPLGHPDRAEIEQLLYQMKSR
ncbi:MAG: O-GlcNAc transferase [Myxococcaceae bacterium]|nr:O-GlcNAc transferase [Myxococcaceae bacterium]